MQGYSRNFIFSDPKIRQQHRNVTRLFLDPPEKSTYFEARIKELMTKILVSTSVDVRFVPDIFDFRLLNFSVSEVIGLPVLNLTDSPMFGINQLAKAIEDRLVAGISLLILSPLMALISLGVKLSSPGPVFYRQERVSWNGLTFTMLKYRSMRMGAEQS